MPTGGVIQIKPDPGVWTQLPDQPCVTVIFERGEVDLATSGTPGDSYFHVGADDGIFSLGVRGNGNANSIWIRTNGEPVTFIWTT